MSELKVRDIIELIGWAEESQKPMSERDVRYVDWGTWDQTTWAAVWARARDLQEATRLLKEEPNLCGTAYCIAGRRVANEGYLMLYSEIGDSRTGTLEMTANYCVKGRPTGRYHADGTPILEPEPDADQEDIEDLAARLLGLDEWEQQRLFNGGNRISDLKRITNEVCSRRGVPEPYDYDLRTGGYVLSEEYANA